VRFSVLPHGTIRADDLGAAALKDRTGRFDGACEAAENCERCDDGNVVDGDGCSSVCRFECNFNTAGKAKGIKALKQCSAAEAANGSNLGVEVDDPCAELTVDLKCKAIVQADGSTPINGVQDSGWSLFTLTRSTILDSTVGAGTVIDFPVTFSIPNDAMDGKGGLKFQATSTQALFGIFGPSTALSECANLEVVDIGLLAPGGKPFARLGTSTRSKDSVGLGGAS
jgi:cysteine-rich repeat protein